MSLKSNILDGMQGFSKAMYSTWLYWKPGRIMLDCGEGVSTGMANFVFGVESVFLSHGHHDHIGGLPGVAYARSAARGDKEKPLSIYYPGGWNSIKSMRDYIGDAAGRSYPLNWVKLEDGMTVPLSRGGKEVSLTAFRANHSRRGDCFGFSVSEVRSRLLPEFAGKSPDELKAARSTGRNIHERYTQKLLAYSGDSAPVGLDHVRGVEVLVHEATFLKNSDRNGNGHSTAEEAMLVAMQSGAKALLLVHVSGRYAPHEVRNIVGDIVKKVQFNLPLAFMVDGKVVVVQ